MRKTILVLLIISMSVPGAFARKPRDKAGTVSNHVYTDKKYNFNITFNDNWKYKIKANKEHYRLYLTQMDYEIPPDYLNAPDYTLIPKILVFVDTTSLSVPAFVDSLLSEKYKSKQKKEISKEFELFNSSFGSSTLVLEKIVPRKRKNIKISGVKSLFWTGLVKYRHEISTSTAFSGGGGIRVYGGYGINIIGVKKKNRIFLFLTQGEWVYFDNIINQALELAKSLEWIEEKK